MELDAEVAFKAVGWLGQAFFFARFFLQWWASERARRIVVPSLFWQMSIAGAVCRLVWAVHDEKLLFVADPVINLFVYVRNTMLLKEGRALDQRVLLPLSLGLASFIGLVAAYGLKVEDPPLWFAIGSLGQLLWLTRFPLQWWMSEREGRAVLPAPFFAVSLLGSILLLTYAFRVDASGIYIAGYALGPFLYGRSLVLSLRTSAKTPEAPLDVPPASPAARGP